MMSLTRIALAVALGGSAWGAGKFTKEQLEARFPYDLGSAEVDVSGYPKAQQDNYAVFKKTCSQCHTLARPLNAPILQREKWKRFVVRMHLRAKARKGTSISSEQAKSIVDFLAYDSKVRKMDRKAAFEAERKELGRLFEEVKKERERLQVEADKKKARQTPMGPDVSPTP